jgi:hypothetical protein
MTPEEKTRLDNIETKLDNLIDYFYVGDFPDRKVYDKLLQVKKIRLPNSAIITGGASTTNATITAEVGTLPAGSIYISSNGTGEIWVMLTTTWTKLSIP